MSSSLPPGLELQVDEADAGSRLDVVLVRRVEAMTRAKARRMIADGEVRVNGRRVRKGARLALGDRVLLDSMPIPSDFAAAPAVDLPLLVRYEDVHLVVVDKPARVPTHPLRPDETETLAGALVARYPEMAGVGYSPREPGIVHRLDNDTSGVIVAARNAAAFDALRAALTSGQMDKRYQALVHGEVAAGVCEAPIAPHPSDPRRVQACVSDDDHYDKARPARTEILEARAIGAYSLLELRASVAVRHQIRAHLAAIDRPLCGDWLYGGPSIPDLERHFLHASRVSFLHPIEHTPLEVSSPLPNELLDALKRAERSS
jgi:23S rRNA pseudouridine1911/1915/1917 synthase